LATSFLKENLADRLIVILAPKIVGVGIDAIGDLGVRRMDHALVFPFQRIIRRGPDLIVDARMPSKNDAI
jgi:riboflavin biosynthesis pyrimidine reductase